MKEIAENIGIEQNSLGLIGGFINGKNRVVLIDSPFKKSVHCNWRASLGLDENEQQCYLIVLDTNYDRLMGLKGCDCVIVAQNNAIAPIRSRSLSPKLGDEVQQYSESVEPVVSINRLVPPEMSFEKNLRLFVDDMQIDLEHHAGANQAGVWVDIPEEKIVFVGDTVLAEQPPFLAYADLAVWEEDLKILASKRFKDYQIISSRSGLVEHEQVAEMAARITFIRELFDDLKEKEAPFDEWLASIEQISAKTYQLDLFNNEIFYNRLHWGITTYYDLNIRERG